MSRLPFLVGVATLAAACSTAQTPEEVVLQPVAAEGAPALAAQPADPCAACEAAAAGFDWSKQPAPTFFPRPGYFPILPKGPGYYSLRDQLTGECSKAPPKYPYPRFILMANSLFDTDWRYLEGKDAPAEKSWSESLKRIPLGDNLRFSTGGALWDRYLSENNSRLTSTNNYYNLTRVRAYGDLMYKDDLRIYAEFLGAWTTDQALAPLPIDRNNADLLNLFVDLKVAEIDGAPAYVRAGRQELLFGSQRLVSPLEWANTRRTFDGVRAFRHTEKLDFDIFWSRPVIANATAADSSDDKQNFAGAWATYKPKKGTSLDGYYLMLDNANAVAQQGIARAPFTRHTLGARFAGDKDEEFLWDFESAVQFGNQDGHGVLAGMATAGVGKHWKDAPLAPTLWLCFNHFSGDNTPGAGEQKTFHQLFPFGHYYGGWTDLVGEQNINDLNVHLYMYPTKWLTTWVQYHRFWLADSKDALYNKSGVAYRRDPTGAAGTDVGHEIDFVANVHVTQQFDVGAGYSQLFGGTFLSRAAGPGKADNASVTFVQATYRW